MVLKHALLILAAALLRQVDAQCTQPATLTGCDSNMREEISVLIASTAAINGTPARHPACRSAGTARQCCWFEHGHCYHCWTLLL